MTADQSIDYEALTQDAMRGVVRAVLANAARSGLPGDHHFYISFDTQAPGVILSKRLKDNPKYRHEMTIVLQHRFWDLSVGDERFEVKLTFDGIPERLVVPFTAVKVFFDPSVRFGLQFDDGEGSADGEPGGDDGDREITQAPVARATTSRSQGPRKPRAAKKPRAERETAVEHPVAAAPAPVVAPVAEAPSKQSHPAPQQAGLPSPGELPAKTGSAEVERPVASGAQIVSLDQFRKK